MAETNPLTATNPFAAMLVPSTSEIAPEYADLQMQRQILAALLGSSFGGGDTKMAGNVAIRTSPLAAIGRLLTGGMAIKGMQDLTGKEADLVSKQGKMAAQQAAALNRLVQGTPGTAGTIQEEAGPPNPATGEPSVSVRPGTPGQGPSPESFAKAYEAARRWGVDPLMLAQALQQYQGNQMMARFPGAEGMLPWNAPQPGAQPQFTPGDANKGFSLSMPTVAGGAGGASGGGVGGMMNLAGGPIATAMMASGIPGYVAIGKQIAEASKPVAGRAGAPIMGLKSDGTYGVISFSPTLGPGMTMDDKGNVSVAPGYQGAAAATQGQQAQIQSVFQPQKITLTDGREVLAVQTSPGNFRVLQPGETVPGAPQAGTAPGTPPAGTAYPGGPPMGAAGGYTTIDPRMSPAQQAVARADATGQVPITAARDPGAAGFVIGQTSAGKAEQTGVGTNLAKQQEAIDTDAAKASQDRPRFTQMLAALDKFTPAPGADYKLQLAKILGSYMGYTPEEQKKVAGGDLAAMDVFKSAAIKLASEATRATDASPAAVQVIMMAQSNPNLAMTKGGSRTLLQFADGMAKYKIAKQAFKEQWTASHNGSWAGGEAVWNRGAPADAFIPSVEELRQGMEQGKRELAAAGGGGNIPASGWGDLRVSQ